MTEDQRHDFYRLMLDDTDRLMGTVEQVLRAGEIRQRRSRDHWKDVDFTAIVEESLELARLRHIFPRKRCALVTAPPEPITLLGNAEELRTAVANLIENAVKYSGQKPSISVDVTTPNIDTVIVARPRQWRRHSAHMNSSAFSNASIACIARPQAGKRHGAWTVHCAFHCAPPRR